MTKSDPCADVLFSKFYPPPPLPGLPESLNPPPTRISRIIHWGVGGGIFFRNNPIFKDVTFISMADLTSFQCYAQWGKHPTESPLGVLFISFSQNCLRHTLLTPLSYSWQVTMWYTSDLTRFLPSVSPTQEI